MTTRLPMPWGFVAFAVSCTAAVAEQVHLDRLCLDVQPIASREGQALLRPVQPADIAKPQPPHPKPQPPYPKPQPLHGGWRLAPAERAGAAIWSDRAFAGHVLIRFRVRWPSPGRAARLHCFFMAKPPGAAEGLSAPAARPQSGYELMLDHQPERELDPLRIVLRRHPGGDEVAV